MKEKVIKTVFDSRDQWLRGRQNHIGGSDAASIVGRNPYKSNVQLWEEKTGIRMPEDISDKEYVIYGIRAEALLRELFRLDFPQYQLIYEENNLYINEAYPFAHASLDGVLIDSEGRYGILEIKTTNILQSMQRERWNQRIPDNYYIQVLHYLLVTGYDFAILKAQLKSEWKGVPNLSTRHYFIEREEVEEDLKFLLCEEEVFWKQVREKKRPNLILPEI